MKYYSLPYVFPSPYGGELHNSVPWECVVWVKFPSPYGGELHNMDKVQISADCAGFRPLTGVSCISLEHIAKELNKNGFRPLTGVSCINSVISGIFISSLCFRPLTGVSCIRNNIQSKSKI